MGPRIFGIPAARAPVVAVLRRGPSEWSHVGRWDVAAGRFEPGAWIRANLYPQPCDLSPDGRWLCYFTLKGGAQWRAGSTYVALSRLPWLTALAAWGTCGTWTRGAHFVEDRDVWQLGPPDEGDVGPCQERFGLALTRPATFAVERRRGWTETPDSPPREPGDMWDVRRAADVTMEKPRPGSPGAARLRVQGYFAAFREGEPDGARAPRYAIVDGGATARLDDAQWADWAPDGRLLVATRDGRLQIHDWLDGTTAVRFDADLAALAPAPAPPPRVASEW